MKPALLVACLALMVSCGGRSATKWETLPLGTKADFRAIYFTDASNGWIGGGSYEITGGLVGHTTDGGRTWQFVSNLTPRDRMSVQGLHFFDNGRGIAVTDSGAILATTDAGATWARASTQGGAGRFSSLFFLDERRGWAAGAGDVMRTDNAGELWISASPENTDTRYRSQIRAVHFLDGRSGWAAGMHAFLARTMDGGSTWEPVATPITGRERPSFWDVTFIDTDVGWAVGEEGSMLSTADGGITWTRRSTGLADARSASKLERIPTARGPVEVDAGDRTPGFTVTAVRFVDRNRGWVTGFYAGLGRSLILHTADAGASWQIDAEIPGEDLNALFIQGREAVWAIGARVREGPQAIYRRSLTTK